jgi:hypothetical protein
METWVKSWECLSRLTGLRKLDVVLEYQYDLFGNLFDVMWKEREADLVAPFKLVTAPRDFVVTLPHRTCAIDMDLGPSRCVLKLPAAGSTVELP